MVACEQRLGSCCTDWGRQQLACCLRLRLPAALPAIPPHLPLTPCRSPPAVPPLPPAACRRGATPAAPRCSACTSCGATLMCSSLPSPQKCNPSLCRGLRRATWPSSGGGEGGFEGGGLGGGEMRVRVGVRWVDQACLCVQSTARHSRHRSRALILAHPTLLLLLLPLLLMQGLSILLRAPPGWAARPAHLHLLPRAHGGAVAAAPRPPQCNAHPGGRGSRPPGAAGPRRQPGRACPPQVSGVGRQRNGVGGGSGLATLCT